MNLSILRDWLSSALNEEQGKEAMDTPKFIPEKSLCERDYVIIDMLNSAGHEVVSFTVSDPSLPDNPLIFVSRGFCELTGYTADEVVGKNCRFLQGKKTKEEDVKRIRDALKEEKDCSVNLLNHKKDGTTFINEFFLTQLRTPTKELAYFIGIQVACERAGPGQAPQNPGWIYTMGNHV
ncbi:hypothetical protein ACHAWO_012400 [Cyclotella atomus]|uniref:PAS domain-containing protein n=1 Tax=Cyclotella atomus TaxID=382360 RepID=A0ABD3MWJ2_9STRA